MSRPNRWLLLMVLFAPLLAAAASAPNRPGMLEFGLDYANLDHGYPDWFGQYVRGTYAAGDDVFYGELVNRQAFDEEGGYASIGNAHTWSPDWYTTTFVSSGQDTVFWPQWRVDGALHRKWLERRQLVTSVGFSYVDSHDVYKDYALTLGGLYYFDGPWVLEGGARFNRSTPGDVDANSYFAALTYGRAGERYLTARVDSGREAYQLVDSGETLQDFSSHAFSLTWREWLAPDYGVTLGATHYANPYYQRNGVTAGWFMQF